ncbi:MAG: DUF4013 domain-containing protein [Chloroflexi bacterium]|nr:DUF4013 domain-containing protein [Chloroflexota bacterium]
MLSGIDLKQLFLFPIKDAESRRYFFIGCVVALAGFIIPVVPYLALFGYVARIAKQVFNNEEPRMIPWDDWGGMIKDGLMMFGVRLVYSLPILVLSIPFICMGLSMPVIMENVNSSEVESTIAIISLAMTAFVCILVPLALPLAVIIPAAEMYAVDKNEFAAGMKFREWWAIFRANLGGFIAAFAIYYVVSMALTFAVQILFITIILACLVPILLPALTNYAVLIMYTTIAQAYQAGRQKLAQAGLNPAQDSPPPSPQT